jgi:phosphohistidine phosphatase
LLDLVLVRHAIAFERDRARWPDDARRPLTPAGRRRFRKAARGLSEWLPRVDGVLVSPLARAQQTAELLQRDSGWPEAILCEELAPGVATARVLSRVRRQSGRVIALVGHEPDLTALLSAAIAGSDARLPIELRKGGTACVRFAGTVEAGGATLRWLIPPAVLRGLR